MKERLESLEWKPELPPQNKGFIPKGWRGATLRWFGFNLRDAGVSREIIEQTIRKAAMEICLPPYTETQADYLIGEIFKAPKIKTTESTP